MNYRENKKKMVLNTYSIFIGWGYEVHISDLHFTPGETVTLIAKAENERFDIYINGELRGDFHYRPTTFQAINVKRIEFGATEDSGSELKSLEIFY